MVIVKIEDCRSLGYCARGVREFFERYNLNYVGFLTEGIPSEELLAATNSDGMALAVVEVARGRQQ